MAKIAKRKWQGADGEAKEAWRVDYKDASGVRRAKQFDRKADAEAYRKRIERELDDGIHLAPSDSPTLAQVAGRWLEAGKLRNWRTSTRKQAEQHVAHIERRAIGGMKLATLTHAHVEQFAIALVNETSRPLAKKVLTTLKGILKYAKRAHLADGITIKSNGTRKLEIGKDIPTVHEVRAILENAKGKWRIMLAVAVYTGLRASEIRGLRWADVDLKAQRLHVRQRADMWRALGEPKSTASERSIPFGRRLAHMLKEWKLACPESELDLVFPSATGNVLAGAKLAFYALWPPQIAAGLTVPVSKPKKSNHGKEIEREPKYLGMHALRHFHASWLINRREDGGLGLPAKNVQERLGHSDIRMTMNTYSHLFPMADSGELDEAEEALMGVA